MSATCRSCQGSIEWATMPTGRLMPIDALPDPSGNLAVKRDERRELRGRVVTDAEPLRGDEKPATSHFATCPNADQHRRR